MKDRIKHTLLASVVLLLIPVIGFGQLLQEVTAENCILGDCVDGRGTMELSTQWGKGSYVGNFADSEFHGKGRLELPISFTSKSIYDGNWNMSVREGRGTYWNGTGDLYMGQWKGNKRNGLGSYFFNLGKWEENKNSEYWLKGNTENYSGEFLNDHYHGKGVFRWETGKRYEGNFFAGKKHGYGIFYYETGNTREQLWDYGDFVR
ncbi:MAG: hypothetical protein ACJA2Q_001209 [Pseudohongiellaceae bacterium]